jgi:Uma2 family endonuclease
MSAATTVLRDGDIIELGNVSWELYSQLRDDPVRARIRMSYLDGELSLMSPSGPHERINRLLERLVWAWCEVHDLPIASFGSTTFRREPQAGLEPDTCFYLEHEPLVRAREDLDLAIDPPPDLAIEVEISSRADQRMKIYASLGVPEVWRTDGDSVSFTILQPDGDYRDVAESRSLPGLSASDLARFLEQRLTTDETTLLRDFRAWAARQPQ